MRMNLRPVYCIGKNAEYQELAAVVLKGDHQALESHIEKHISQKDPMASLTSRYCGVYDLGLLTCP